MTIFSLGEKIIALFSASVILVGGQVMNLAYFKKPLKFAPTTLNRRH